MSQRDPQNRLSILEELDFESPEERRIALFTLNDYFGAVFTEVGHKLDFRTSVYENSVGHQWNKASNRLEKVESVNIPEKYDKTLHSISDLRGNYAHDFGDYPPVDPIENAQEVAPDWGSWIREAAKKYEKYQESLTATEALLQVGDRALDHNLKNWFGHPPYLSEQAKDLNEQSITLRKKLQEFSDNDDITKEFVETTSEILEWERTKNKFNEEAEDWLKKEEERKEMEVRSSNTHNFIVVDEADKYDDITVVKHDIGQPDDTYSFNISNCPISEDKRDHLRNLDVNDEVRLWIGDRQYRNSNGHFDFDPIIEDVII